jgi:hypothetical protein
MKRIESTDNVNGQRITDTDKDKRRIKREVISDARNSNGGVYLV